LSVIKVGASGFLAASRRAHSCSLRCRADWQITVSAHARDRTHLEGRRDRRPDLFAGSSMSFPLRHVGTDRRPWRLGPSVPRRRPHL